MDKKDVSFLMKSPAFFWTRLMAGMDSCPLVTICMIPRCLEGADLLKENASFLTLRRPDSWWIMKVDPHV